MGLKQYKLQYRAIDIPLIIDEFIIGRESVCNLVLEDALVSRKHAVIRVVGEHIEIEDLNSRNGVYVNNKKIEGPTQLAHGDRIRIGSQELSLKDYSIKQYAKKDKGLKITRTIEFFGLCKFCSEPLPKNAQTCPICQAEVSPSQQNGSSTPPSQTALLQEEEPTISSMALLAGLADKALSMGRSVEADRILAGILNDTLERARNNEKLEHEEFRKATKYSLLLVEATQKPHWLDYLFQLYDATEQLMPAEVIDNLYRIVNNVKYTNRKPLGSYLLKLRKGIHNLNPNERFLLNRLEGLEKLVSSK